MNKQTLKLLSQISGQKIEKQLVELAKIGGVKIKPSPELKTRYAVSRLALTKTDLLAKQYLKEQMLLAGMKVEEHPLGLIGTYQGTDPHLTSVAMLSHYDSVPEAGMYDGTVGVITAIQVIKAINQLQIRTQHPLKVIAVTGEESSRFNMALFGSKGMFHGLTKTELELKDNQGISINQALIQLGYNPEKVKEPIFKPQDFKAVIEFHVAQDKRYPDKLVVVSAIAAPERYKLLIGQTKLKPFTPHTKDKLIAVTINGTTGHSGATPMGTKYRNDGLVIASKVITAIHKLNHNLKAPQILVSGCQVSGQAMNKIPGKVQFSLCITGQKNQVIQQQLNELLGKLKQTEKPGIIEFKPQQKSRTSFYKANFSTRLLKAIKVIQIVNKVAQTFSKSNCVGTVSTFNTKEGQIELGIDLRGIKEQQRAKMIEQIKAKVKTLTKLEFHSKLPGSGQPETMDPKLVKLAEKLIKQLNIAPQVTSFSAAGHDIQNVSRAGIATLLLFCPSPNGIAHKPDEYTPAQQLEWGAKAMASLVLELAN